MLAANASLGLFLRHAKARACAARNGSATAYIDIDNKIMKINLLISGVLIKHY